MPRTISEFHTACIFSELEQAAKDDGSERLLSHFTRACLERMLYQQLQRSTENAGTAVSKIVSNLKRIESSFIALHEHERLVDKEVLKMLAKVDSFLVSGRQRGTGNPLAWYRYGFPFVDGWKLRGDLPKAYALLRSDMFMFQLTAARSISEGLYQNSHQQHQIMACDFVRK